jgi:hypothetical protein
MPQAPVKHHWLSGWGGGPTQVEGIGHAICVALAAAKGNAVETAPAVGVGALAGEEAVAETGPAVGVAVATAAGVVEASGAAVGVALVSGQGTKLGGGGWKPRLRLPPDRRYPRRRYSSRHRIARGRARLGRLLVRASGEAIVIRQPEPDRLPDRRVREAARARAQRRSEEELLLLS